MYERRRKKFNRRGWASLKEEDSLNKNKIERRCLINDGGKIDQSGSLYFWPWPWAKSWSSEWMSPPPRLKSRWVKVGSTCAKGQAGCCPSRQHWTRTGPDLPHHPFLSECLRQCPHLLLCKASVFIKIQELEKCSIDWMFVCPPKSMC